MSAASLIGFGVVFLLVSWLASSLLTAMVRIVAPRGPAVERRTAFLAAALPVLLAAAVVTILVVESLIGEDHCRAHDHHAHLCLAHGVAWADRGWAVAFVAAGCAAVLARGAALAHSMLRGLRLMRRLRWTTGDLKGESKGESGEPSAMLIVPSERPFCFVAGMRRPRIFVSTAARRVLAEDEWQAMLAHERGHIEQGDLRHRLGLELLLLFAAPLAGALVREHWDSATERLRDADAAAQATPEAVASALVRMAKAALRLKAGPLVSFTPPADGGLAKRITSLLDRSPLGEGDARRVARIALLSGGALALLALALAAPLHHALETLLG
jgi:Zn-dependent protease with chaperone function